MLPTSKLRQGLARIRAALPAVALRVLLVTLLMAPLLSGAPINYALGQPATASGVESTCCYAISYGNDGNLATAWNGGSGSNRGGWWQVDLGSIIPIDDVTIYSAASNTFDILYNSDGSSWIQLGAQTTGPGGSLWSDTFVTGVAGGEVARLIARDKKVAAGTVGFVLLESVGRPVAGVAVPVKLQSEVIAWLLNR